MTDEHPTITAGELLAWRKGAGLTQAQAAERLGVSVRSLISYEKPGADVPLVVSLAVFALELEVIGSAVADFAQALGAMREGLELIAEQVRVRLGRPTVTPQETTDEEDPPTQH